MPAGIESIARVIVVRDGGKPKLAIAMEIFDLSWAAGQVSALDGGTIGKGHEVGSIKVQRAGKDVVSDVTFAFVVHAFHTEITIVQ